MADDRETVERMRAVREPTRDKSKSFMAASEVLRLRQTVMRVSQARLAAQLISPEDGEPISQGAVWLWENGRRAVPLWAARQIRAIAEACKRYDARQESA
jgi:hypothetical protein